MHSINSRLKELQQQRETKIIRNTELCVESTLLILYVNQVFSTVIIAIVQELLVALHFDRQIELGLN